MSHRSLANQRPRTAALAYQFNHTAITNRPRAAQYVVRSTCHHLDSSYCAQNSAKSRYRLAVSVFDAGNCCPVVVVAITRRLRTRATVSNVFSTFSAAILDRLSLLCCSVDCSCCRGGSCRLLVRLPLLPLLLLLAVSFRRRLIGATFYLLSQQTDSVVDCPINSTPSPLLRGVGRRRLPVCRRRCCRRRRCPEASAHKTPCQRPLRRRHRRTTTTQAAAAAAAGALASTLSVATSRIRYVSDISEVG